MSLKIINPDFKNGIVHCVSNYAVTQLCMPTTNNVSERDFGVLDILVRIKPAASDHAYETYIMWLHNKPSKWLDEMPYKEKMTLLDKARHRYPQMREQYIAKKDTVKKQHVASLKSKMKKQEQKEERSRNAKVVATQGVVGLLAVSGHKILWRKSLTNWKIMNKRRHFTHKLHTIKKS